MSVVTRSKTLNQNLNMTSAADPHPGEPPSPDLREVVAEAPEHRACREAPESSRGRQPEAPDAGEGRANTLAHEFTHGRSKS